MKRLLFIFLIFTNQLASATNYYVSNTGGGDTLQTVSEVNALRFTLNPGDSILFKCGQTFTGNITMGASTPDGSQDGTLTNRIVFGSYGSGVKPIIDATNTLSGWADEGGGIYSVSSPSGIDDVASKLIIDDELQPKGRSNYYTYTSATTTTITGTFGDSKSDQQVVVAVRDWIWNTRSISSHVGSVVTVTNGFDDNDDSGTLLTPNQDTCFFQNDSSYLDDFGEWAIRDGKVYVYFGSETPSNYNVRITNTDQVFYLVNSAYYTIDGLRLEGGNKYAYRNNTSVCAYNDVNNCEFAFGGIGIRHNGTNSSITNNKIEQCSELGIESNSYKHTIENNYIDSICLFIGLKYFDGGGMGIESRADTSLIRYNTIKYTSDDGISQNATHTTISHNYIYDFNRILIDGGGIYLFGQDNTERFVNNNIIIIGRSMGIYTDDQTNHISVYNNYIENCYRGFHIHNAYLNNYSNNTIFNCERLINAQTDNITSSTVTQDTITDNICVAGSNTDYYFNFRIWDGTDSIHDLGVMNYNYYVSNDNPTAVFQTKENGGSYIDDSFSEFVSRYGYDIDGQLFDKSPSICYNATMVPITILQNSTAMTVNGRVSNYQLGAFESLVYWDVTVNPPKNYIKVWDNGELRLVKIENACVGL